MSGKAMLLGAALVLAGSIVQPVRAAEFNCDTSSAESCTLSLSPEGGASIALRAPGTQFTMSVDGSGFEVSGTVELLGDVNALQGYAVHDAYLVAEYDNPSQPQQGFRRLRGSAEVVLGAGADADSGFGMFEAGAETSRRMDIGFELGTVLRDELGIAHLNPERICQGLTVDEPGFAECPYWIFNYVEQTGVGMSFGGTDIGLNLTAESSVENRVLFLMDPEDFFVYVGVTTGELDSITLGIESAAAEPEDESGPLTNAKRGLGFSQHGYIPFEVRTDYGIEKQIGELGLNFTGHMVLDWKGLPLGPVVRLDGSYVVRFPVNEFTSEIEMSSPFQLAGNGDLSVKVPVLGDAINWQMAIGDATAGMKVGDDQQVVFLSGDLNKDMPWKPDALPLNLDLNADYKVAAVFVNDVDASTAVPYINFTESFVQMEGEFLFDLSLGNPAAEFGRELRASGMLRADFDDGFRFAGMLGEGTSATAIHPLIQGDRDVRLRLHVDPNIPSNQMIELDGGFSIGGDTFSQRGILRITPADAYLGFPLSFDPSLVLEAYEDIQAATQSAEDEVLQLNSAVDYQRSVVQAERDAHKQALQSALADLAAAQSEVNRLGALVARYHRDISYYKGRIGSWYRWYRKQPWYKRASAYARYLSMRVYYNGLIASRYAAIGGVATARGVATLALNVAHGTVATARAAVVVTPIDLDPRVGPLVVSRDAALGILNGLQAAMPEIPSIPGTIQATMGFRLNDAGLVPETRAEYCDGGKCIEIRGGTYDADKGLACITLPTAGEARICTAVPPQA